MSNTNFITFGCKLMCTVIVWILYEPMTFSLVRTHQDAYYHSSQDSPLCSILPWAPGRFDAKAKRLTESQLQRDLYVDVNFEWLKTCTGSSKKKTSYILNIMEYKNGCNYCEWNVRRNTKACDLGAWVWGLGLGIVVNTSRPGIWGREYRCRVLWSGDVGKNDEDQDLRMWVYIVWFCDTSKYDEAWDMRTPVEFSRPGIWKYG